MTLQKFPFALHLPRRSGLALVCLLALHLPAALFAQSDPPLDRSLELRVQEIASQLRCPTCQALSVMDSDASFSVQIRDKVRRMVEEGQSEEAIKAYFISRYGEWILRTPPAQGLGLVLWLLPGVALLFAGVWVVLRIRRNERNREHMEDGEDVLTSWQRHQLDQDRQRFERTDDEETPL